MSKCLITFYIFREDAEKMAAQASADKNSHLHNENLKAHSKKSPGATVR